MIYMRCLTFYLTNLTKQSNITVNLTIFINTFNFIYRFSWLPVIEDDDEAVHVYGYLCDLIQANHPLIIGVNNSNLPRIVSIIAEAFHNNAVPDDNPEALRMINIVKQIESNPELFQACIAHLTAEQNTALQEAYKNIINAQPQS